MNKILLIVRREFFSRVSKRSFIMMSILGPILIAFFTIMAIKLRQQQPTQKVIVIDKHHLLNESLKNSDWCTYEYQEEDINDEKFKNSKYDILLFVNKKFASNATIEAFYKETPSGYVRAELTKQLENRLERLKLDKVGIDREAYASIQTPVILKDNHIDGKLVQLKDDRGSVGFIFGFIIFFFIFNYGVMVMRGVLEEKSNRIVEVVVSSVKPVQLMLGKIIGIGLTAFCQFLIWTIMTVALLGFFKEDVFPDKYNPEKIAQNQTAVEVSTTDSTSIFPVNDLAELIYNQINIEYILFALFFLIVGYLMYAAIFAAIGSIVDSDTDTQQFLIPVTLPLLFSFYVAFQTIQDPNGDLATWFSIIPFTAPVVMMTRIATGAMVENAWQVYLSMGLMVITFLAMTYLAAKIYRTGILMYGKKNGYKEVWKWLFYK